MLMVKPPLALAVTPGAPAWSGVRGSIWVSVFIVGAGAPGGVRAPWAKPRAGRESRARRRGFMDEGRWKIEEDRVEVGNLG